MKFKKKPVVIEAVRFVNVPTEIEGEEPDWYAAARAIDREEVGAISYGATGCLYIHTLEGVLRANPGDWIIRGVKGEVYACKSDIFAETYEPAE